MRVLADANQMYNAAMCVCVCLFPYYEDYTSLTDTSSIIMQLRLAVSCTGGRIHFESYRGVRLKYLPAPTQDQNTLTLKKNEEILKTSLKITNKKKDRKIRCILNKYKRRFSDGRTRLI